MDIHSNTDTHHYDGNIKLLYKSLVEIDNVELNNNVSFNNALNEIFTKVESFENGTIDKVYCKNTLYLFENDTQNNYDVTNDIHLEDILTRTWRFVRISDIDILQLFLEQLADVYNGSCPQGRITRIFQFYRLFMENKDKIYDQCRK